MDSTSSPLVGLGGSIMTEGMRSRVLSIFEGNPTLSANFHFL